MFSGWRSRWYLPDGFVAVGGEVTALMIEASSILLIVSALIRCISEETFSRQFVALKPVMMERVHKKDFFLLLSSTGARSVV
jgi:hypothetical protein